MSNIVEIKVPDIGDFDAVEVIEVLVAVGDTIQAEQSLITVESDKASMEIPASQGGVVKSLKVKVGDKVSQGAVILEVEGTDADAAAPSTGQPAASAPVAVAEPDPVPVAAAVAAPAQSGGEQSVVVPDIGDFDTVEVIEVLVAEGDTIQAEQSLITVESDKASMEIPASVGGVVKSLKVKVGDKVSQGSEILVVQVSGAPAASSAPASARPVAPAPAPTAAPVANASVAVPAQTTVSATPARTSPTAAFAESAVPLRNLPHASPSVRKFARELGVNLAQVTGSGPKNRITSEDVRGYVKQALATGGASPVGSTVAAGEGFSVLGWPKVDFAKFGAIDTKPLSRIKKISGANLHRNWVMIPHVTNNDLADITDLEALRQQLNAENKKGDAPKVTMLAFLIKAVVAALRKYPEFNASLDGDNLVYKHYFHIGFAADTPNGLVVPVIRDADRKGVLELAAETAELAKVARDGKLSPSQMQGGCFSISSLGGIGGTDFTPIINAPEVAILGVSRSSMQPVWDGKSFQPRLMLPLSLSYDHRVIDGATAARFNAYLTGLLADFRRIIL
ncbi:MAG: dihydrolipoyllysine-residue acetyltransferase [Castellaniella sp.]|uniref:dihydrolipoyllysine-residue acetyltransferase n=1 Tax=Castellaniella sp. TaxID=1955812 RepID=UPI00121D6C5E|nr:dihydrolipoyllysine-residue acetyltransferase [Castellaniella sp.]TAN30685.1 MAG: dihydrolipoyllysine-residue acetyltransferase [Castellaniella sp.]